MYRALLAALLAAVLLSPAGRADAANTVLCSGYTSCQSKGYSNFGYSTQQSTSYWAMYTGTNCTNYVAYRLVTTNGMANRRPASGVGNARDWGTTMSSITDTTPAVGAVAWWGRASGRNHVSYIEKVVSSTEIWVSESNWSGAFDWRKITKSGSDWPDGFIHFADPQPEQTMLASVYPALASTPKVGTQVQVTDGTWVPTGSDLRFTYQWLDDGENISGATSDSFTPTASMLGHELSVRVIATRPGFRTKYVRTAAVEVQPGGLTAVVPPTVSGTPRENSTLSASTGTWSPSSTDDFSYRWIADSAAIPGATGSTFTPGAENVGQRIKVQVAAKHPDYGLRTARSEFTEVVAPEGLTVVDPPTVSGTLRVGSTLTAQAGSWLPQTDRLSYRWIVGGVGVASGPTFTVRPEDVGKTVIVQEAAQLSGYSMRTTRTDPSDPVAEGVIARGSRPTIKGTPNIGWLLTASDGTWRPKDRTLTYQWVVGNDPVPGATSKTFRARVQDGGHSVTVYVTAHRDGYADRQSLPATRVYVPRR